MRTRTLFLVFVSLSSPHRKLFLPYLSMTINTQKREVVRLGRHPLHQWNKSLEDTHPYNLTHLGAECVTSLFPAAGNGRRHSLCKSTISPSPSPATLSSPTTCCLIGKGNILHEKYKWSNPAFSWSELFSCKKSSQLL